MSLFRHDAEPAKPAAPPSATAPTERPRGFSTIAGGTRIEGKVGGATDLVVEGVVQGEIRLDAALTVAAGGKVVGSIEARAVRILGSVEGEVRGRERVELAPSGALTGDVSAPKVIIAEGAFFKGKIEMLGPEAGKPGAAAGA